jgi:hypothetical protein
MDRLSFSSLSRALSARSTRRAALSGIGGCGIAAGLSGVFDLRGANSAFARQDDAASDDAAWRLAGDVMEACRCEVTCPCNFGSDPTYLPCESMVGWRIREGQYGDVSLNGLNLLALLVIPGNVFAGDLTMGYYFDERATPAQADALEAIFYGQAGGWPAALSPLIANPLPLKLVPIQFELADGQVHVTVPGLVEVGSESVPNPFPGQPPLELQVNNLAVPFYTGPAEVRRSTILKVTDPDLSFEYAARSSLIGTFEYSG